MITWVGLIGKVFGFLGQEMAKKALNAEPDKRALACEAFTRLYFNLTKLERLTELVLASVEDSIHAGNTVSLTCRVHNMQQDIQRLSSDFFEDAQVLREVVEIFDPEAAEALSAVFAWKGSILWEASKCVTLTRDGDDFVGKLSYRKPTDKILDLDISQQLAWQRAHPGEVDWEALTWPQTLLVGGELSEAFAESEVTVVSKADMEEFADILKAHLLVLSEAKGSIRNLIKTNFSLDDVLFQNWTERGFL